MHIEILVEDSSGEKLLNELVPKILGSYGAPHTWRIHSYKGIGRIPKGLKVTADPSKRVLLDQLPKLLRGYGRTQGIDAVVVVVDVDERDCRQFLQELLAVSEACDPAPNVMFRLAIEEMEAWLLGDAQAFHAAFPRARKDVLRRYVQDSQHGTWEIIADAVYKGGSTAVKKVGWPLPGQLKHEWVEKIGPFMDIENNASPSFGKFRDGLRRLIAA